MRQDDRLTLPHRLQAQSRDREIAAIIETQRLTFEARRNSLISEVATLQDGINGFQKRIDGGEQQLQYVHEQLRLFEEELVGKSELLAKGLVKKSEVLSLRRAQANLRGEIGRLTGEIGDATERIARTRQQMQALQNAAVKQAVEQMHEVAAEYTDLTERVRAARSVLDRVNITAPVHGVVIKLRYHTPGGVIEPGKIIMQILPLGAELIIEARVGLRDVDNVKVNQDAEVRLTALSARVTPTVKGKVIYLSADSVPDESSGQASARKDVYIARIKLDSLEAARIPNFSPTPGMPVEVYIKSGERTFFEYLTRPIRDSMSRAFRES
jgi:HlyD family secretion protein